MILVVGLILLLILVVVFFISGSSGSQRVKIKQTELDAEAAAVASAAAQPRASDPIVTPLQPEAEADPEPEPLLWNLNEGKDLSYNDIFHLEICTGICNPEGNRILDVTSKSARTRMCLNRCAKDEQCKAVVFDSKRLQCWGKSATENLRAHNDRHYFARCRDASSSPNCKAVDGVSAPAPAPASKPSDNARCGPYGTNNKKCPGKQCCSKYHWCAGEQGTSSAWCSGPNATGGKSEYDGEG
tara:strand:- start:1505 stop:2230 length:726 start_codon:yes stop_codon:yes gene_type:complete